MVNIIFLTWFPTKFYNEYNIIFCQYSFSNFAKAVYYQQYCKCNDGCIQNYIYQRRSEKQLMSQSHTYGKVLYKSKSIEFYSLLATKTVHYISLTDSRYVSGYIQKEEIIHKNEADHQQQKSLIEHNTLLLVSLCEFCGFADVLNRAFCENL